MRTDEIERRFSKAAMQQLIIIAGADPVVLARSDYFRDEHFDSKFDPHPAHPDSAPDTLEEKARRAQEELNRRLQLAEAEKQSALDELEQMRRSPPQVASSGLALGWKTGAYLGVALAVLLVISKLRHGTPEESVLAATSATQAPQVSAGQHTESSQVQQAPAPAPVGVAAVPQPAVAAPQSLTVAAVSANVRSEPTDRGAPLLTLSRGDAVTLLSSVEGFHQVRTRSGQEGWIAERVVFDGRHFGRLESLTAQAYSDANGSRLDEALKMLRTMRNDMNTALEPLATDPKETLARAQRAIMGWSLNIDSDPAAAKWFGLMAEFEEKSGRLASAISYSLAAMSAEPLNAEHYHRFLIAHYRLGNFEEIRKLAVAGPMLAPASTNSWMLLGIAEATADRPAHATGAFRIALAVSRSAANTQRYFQELASTSTDARVAAAIQEALIKL